MNIDREVIGVLEEVLNLRGRSAGFDRATPLLGSIPELDSMVVATLITSLEERFGFAVNDDEIDGATFESVGTLADFVKAKLAA